MSRFPSFLSTLILYVKESAKEPVEVNVTVKEELLGDDRGRGAIVFVETKGVSLRAGDLRLHLLKYLDGMIEWLRSKVRVSESHVEFQNSIPVKVSSEVFLGLHNFQLVRASSLSSGVISQIDPMYTCSSAVQFAVWIDSYAIETMKERLDEISHFRSIHSFKLNGRINCFDEGGEFLEETISYELKTRIAIVPRWFFSSRQTSFSELIECDIQLLKGRDEGATGRCQLKILKNSDASLTSIQSTHYEQAVKYLEEYYSPSFFIQSGTYLEGTESFLELKDRRDAATNLSLIVHICLPDHYESTELKLTIHSSLEKACRYLSRRALREGNDDQEIPDEDFHIESVARSIEKIVTRSDDAEFRRLCLELLQIESTDDIASHVASLLSSSKGKDKGGRSRSGGRSGSAGGSDIGAGGGGGSGGGVVERVE